MNRSLKIAAILAYLFIVLNSLYGLIISPYILSTIGPSEYGVYKSIASLATSLMIVDIGIGGTTQKYIATLLLKSDKNKLKNYYAMILVQALVIIFVISLAALLIFLSLDRIYSNSFTVFELMRTKQLFIFLSLNLVVHVLSNTFQGVITGHNNFAVINITKIIALIIRTLLLFVFLDIFKNSLVIVIISLVLDLTLMLFYFIYVMVKLRLLPKLYAWDKDIFNESLKYSLFLFVQSIVTQINSNLDNTIIGAYLGAVKVAIYSFGLLMFNMFQQLSATLSALLLPSVIGLIEEKDNKTKLNKMIIDVGKIQYMLLGAAFIGFVLVGKEFVYLWLGYGYEDVWLLSIILMFPAIFTLIINTNLAILRAKNLLKFRTLILILMASVNIFVTIILIKKIDYFGAALGTGISIIIGELILMNIYYIKKLKLNMINIYKNILLKNTIALIPPALIIFYLNSFWHGNLYKLILKIGIFVVIYIISLVLINFSEIKKYIIQLKSRKAVRK